MKRKLIIIAFIFQSYFLRAQDIINFTVASCNMLKNPPYAVQNEMAKAGSYETLFWNNFKNSLYDCDIICFQEWAPDLVGPHLAEINQLYTIYDSQSKDARLDCAILVKKTFGQKFTQKNLTTIVKRHNQPDALEVRAISLVIDVTHANSTAQIAIINCHIPQLSNAQSQEQIDTIFSLINGGITNVGPGNKNKQNLLTQEKIPIIICGDFNYNTYQPTDKTYPASPYVRPIHLWNNLWQTRFNNQFIDVAQEIAQTNNRSVLPTSYFNRFSRIDYMLYTPSLTPAWNMLAQTYTQYPSDLKNLVKTKSTTPPEDGPIVSDYFSDHALLKSQFTLKFQHKKLLADLLQDVTIFAIKLQQ